MRFEVIVYDQVKYNPESKEVARVFHDEVDELHVVRLEDRAIYKKGFDEVDERGEYAVLIFMNGSTSTYRNSHVDIFRA